MRPRSMRSPALVVTAVLVGLTALAGCASDSPQAAGPGAAASAAPSARAVQWVQVPDSPLTPRLGAIAVSLGDRLLVVGGADGPPCPVGADCLPGPEPRRDGAVYDPATREWSPLAEAPVGLDDGYPAVVVGSRLYVLDGGDERQLVSSAGS